MQLGDFTGQDGDLPSQSEEIFENFMKVLNSEKYRIMRQSSSASADYLTLALGLIALLNETGYTEEAFRVLIHQTCSGALEDPFVIGSILRSNGVWGSWSPKSDWESILKICGEYATS